MQSIAELPHTSKLSYFYKFWLAILVFFIIPISGLSIDIYVPSLPAVSHYFGVDKSLVQLTITAYMVGIGLMQLFAGSISDSFGRKKPFIVASFIYIVATLAIPFADTITQLLFLRFIQGLTVAVLVVPMRSVISDLFQGSDYLKMVNYMVIAWSIGPIIAPAIGGYLQFYFGWQANFYFLAAYSLCAFIMICIFMPETSVHKHPFHLIKILKLYKSILSHHEFVMGLIINGLIYSLVILFSIVAPFLLQSVLHYSSVQFGHVALMTGFAWFIGSILNRILFHFSIERKAKFGLSLMLIIALLSLIIDVILPLNAYLIVIPAIALFVVGGMIFPNYFARAIALFPKNTASANALYGGFVFLISGISSSLGTLLKSESVIPLAMTYVGLISLSLVIYYAGHHYHRALIRDKTTRL